MLICTRSSHSYPQVPLWKFTFNKVWLTDAWGSQKLYVLKWRGDLAGGKIQEKPQIEKPKWQGKWWMPGNWDLNYISLYETFLCLHTCRFSWVLVPPSKPFPFQQNKKFTLSILSYWSTAFVICFLTCTSASVTCWSQDRSGPWAIHGSGFALNPGPGAAVLLFWVPPLFQQGNPSLSLGDFSTIKSVTQISLKSQSGLDLCALWRPVLPGESPGCIGSSSTSPQCHSCSITSDFLLESHSSQPTFLHLHPSFQPVAQHFPQMEACFSATIQWGHVLIPLSLPAVPTLCIWFYDVHQGLHSWYCYLGLPWHG